MRCLRFCRVAGSPETLLMSPLTFSMCCSVLVMMVMLCRSISWFSSVRMVRLSSRMSVTAFVACPASSSIVSSVPCSCTFCSIGRSSFAISAASSSSGSRFFIRSCAVSAVANILAMPSFESISRASLVQMPTSSSMETPGTPTIFPRSHTTRPSPSHPESSGPHCALGMGISGVMSMMVSAINPLWFASTSELRGMTMPSSSISTSTSTRSRLGRTESTFPTFTPRTRTCVPTWMPHANGNSTNAWYDRILLKLTPRIQFIVSAAMPAPPMRNRPTPPSQMFVRPNPKSRRGLTRRSHSCSSGFARGTSSPLSSSSPDALDEPSAAEPSDARAKRGARAPSPLFFLGIILGDPKDAPSPRPTARVAAASPRRCASVYVPSPHHPPGYPAAPERERAPRTSAYRP